MSRRRAVVEDVAEMGIALFARMAVRIRETRVADLADIFVGIGAQSWASGARLEFCRRVEQGVVAADAAVESLVVQVPIFSGIGNFSVGVASNVENAGRELLAHSSMDLTTLGTRTFLSGGRSRRIGRW